MNKTRLDQKLVQLSLVTTRSQAESYIRLGQVKVNGKVATKPGIKITDTDKIKLTATEQYVSRAGLKLASVAETLNLDFKDKVVLDVGSSTGGFTDYALQHGARKVIAVDVGTNQLHPSLHGNSRIELYEKTDIRDVILSEALAKSKDLVRHKRDLSTAVEMTEVPDIVVADVSFISLREILPSVAKLCNKDTQIVAMVKPQFEADKDTQKHKGVIKNDKMRREILRGFEQWAGQYFVVKDKADSAVSGTKGNQERFYLLKLAI